MKRYALLLLAAVAFGQQTPGTVTSNSVSNIIATAGTISCTLTNTTPALASGVHVTCTVSGALVLSMDVVVAAGTNGSLGSFTTGGVGGDIVTWQVNQVAGQPLITWTMNANGVGKSGTF